MRGDLAVLLMVGIMLVNRDAAAGGLRKVWSVSIPDVTTSSRSVATAPAEVFSVAFSPDGRRLAATVGPSGAESVLIFNVRAPQSPPVRFAANVQGEKTSFSTALMWSSSGNYLLVGHRLVNLSDGRSCSIPDLAFAHLVSDPPKVVAKQLARPRRLITFDVGCSVVAEVDLGQDLWNILDVSPDTDTLLLWWQHYQGPARVSWDLSVSAARSGDVLRRLPLLEKARFLDRGNMVCGIYGPRWHQTIKCLDARSGEPLGNTREWTAPQIQAARNAKRAIVTDYSRKFDFIDWVWTTGSIKRHVIWDFAARMELGSLHPNTQKTNWGSIPFPVAISPNGEDVLEGGGGVLTLYHVEQ